jgi:hypothetical protein
MVSTIHVHVMSVELTTETIHLACYRASEAGSTTPYHGKAIPCWSPDDPTGADFEAAQQTDAMGVGWTRRHTESRLKCDLAAPDVVLIQGPQGQPTAPGSEKRVRSRKHKPTLG